MPRSFLPLQAPNPTLDGYGCLCFIQSSVGSIAAPCAPQPEKEKSEHARFLHAQSSTSAAVMGTFSQHLGFVRFISSRKTLLSRSHASTSYLDALELAWVCAGWRSSECTRCQGARGLQLVNATQAPPGKRGRQNRADNNITAPQKCIEKYKEDEQKRLQRVGKPILGAYPCPHKPRRGILVSNAFVSSSGRRACHRPIVVHIIDPA